MALWTKVFAYIGYVDKTPKRGILVQAIKKVQQKFLSEQIAPGITTESVLTGNLREKVDGIWDAFWSSGISNPLEVLAELRELESEIFNRVGQLGEMLK